MKEAWRRILKSRRQAISPFRRQEASNWACQQLKKWTKSTRWVLSFASFQSEIDLWPFNQLLADEGRLVLPRLVRNHLHLFCVPTLKDLEKHKWGFLEPKPDCQRVDLLEIEIALIPGLGFDKQTRHRLGYGKGYYDQLLRSVHSMQTWGIGFVEQAVQGMPYSSRDVPLQRIELF